MRPLKRPKSVCSPVSIGSIPPQSPIGREVGRQGVYITAANRTTAPPASHDRSLRDDRSVLCSISARPDASASLVRPGKPQALSFNLVLRSAAVARGSHSVTQVWLERQLHATSTHPSDGPSRDTCHKREWLDVVSHHSAGGNETILAQLVAAYDGRVCTDRRTATDIGSFVLTLPRYVTAGVDNVGEDHARAQKHVILAMDTLVNAHVVLHLDVGAE